MSALSKEEFIQQYTLARANTINSGAAIAVDLIVRRAEEAYNDIRNRCSKSTNNLNRQ